MISYNNDDDDDDIIMIIIIIIIIMIMIIKTIKCNHNHSFINLCSFNQ